MSKKYIPFILTVIAIILATFFWEKIVLTYDAQNQVYGEYSINQYNANNDVLRSLFFILFPLVFFLFSYLILNNKNTLSTKELIFDSKEKIFKETFSLNYYLIFILLVFFLLLEFLSIDFNRFATNLDFFHEGTVLVPSNNFYLTGDLWSSSFIEYGFLGNFGSSFLWKIFGIKTIGLARFPELLLLLLNKILLIYLTMEISRNLLFSEKVKLVYFVILSLLSISLISYKDNIAATEFPGRSFLFLLFFLMLFHSLYRPNKFTFTFFILGTFSIISMLWFIDVGAYINAILLLILVYFLIRAEYKKTLSILFGIIFGWFLFFFIIPSNEFKAFLNNTLLIYSTYDYIWGLIYPTPFLSGDTRSTRALLFIIFAGVLVIISSFNKNIKLNYYNKTFFIFIFIAALISFKTGMTRSDTPHIKSSSGFTIFLIYSLGLFFLFSLALNQNKIFESRFSYFIKKNHSKLLFILLTIYFVTFKAGTINFNNIYSAPTQIKKLINYEDKKYLSSDYKELIEYYKKLSLQDKCIQIITNEIALPYFLNKPTCTNFYFTWSSEINQKKLIDQLKEAKPEIILFNSEIDPWNGDFLQRTPKLIDYINENYSFNSKFKFWTFVKINQ